MSTAPAEPTAAQLAALHAEDEQRRARLTAPDALTNAALWYATSAGWPVFPLRPTGKTPLTGHGFKDATVEPDQIRAWWATWPQANIGTPTGRTFDVIDIDAPDGLWSLTDLRHADCPAGCCATRVCPGTDTVLGLEILAKAYTGGHGRHLLVAPTGQGNGTRLLPGIDYRGEGGYVVLPPSVHASGTHYDWITPPSSVLFAQDDAA